ncbi:hypothetical protein L6452_42620 [Arctium lappa]|uniref:Uncharacterized protein n=1 Tax=Arctium lappa TaxID=4217 RepID=A0ACB8XJ49_ARCLA|nr:hypothetical protein L6452_42620 [Arctium lappa]
MIILERTAEKSKNTNESLVDGNMRDGDGVTPIEKGLGPGLFGNIAAAEEVTPIMIHSNNSRKSSIMSKDSVPVYSFPSFSIGLTQEFGDEGLNDGIGVQQQLHSSSAPSAEPTMDAQRVRTPLVPGSTSDTIKQNVITTKDCTVAAKSLETMVNPVEKRGVKPAVTICSPYQNRKTEDMVTNKLHMKTMVAQFSNNLLASMLGVADIASLKTIDMV